MARNAIAFIAAILILIIGGSFSVVLRHPPERTTADVRLDSIPVVKDGWVAREIRMNPDIERLLDVDRYVYREYMDDSGFSVWLFIGYFSSQRFGSGVHSPRHCLPGSGWEIVSRVNAPLPGDSALRVNKMDIMRGDSRQVMYYWFLTRAGHLNNEYSLKFDLVRSAVLRRPTDAAFIRISVPVDGYDKTDGERRVGEFIRIFKKEIYTSLPFLRP
jgi:EpsI family protein